MNADTFKVIANTLLQTHFFHADKFLCKEETASMLLADGLRPFEAVNKIAHTHRLRRVDQHGLPSMFHESDLTAADEKLVVEKRQEKILHDWTTIET